MNDLVIRTNRGGWVELTLNRPEKLNALTLAMFEELRETIAALAKDDSIGCVVLRGAGKCFSEGHALTDIGSEPVPPGWHSETLRSLETLPPVVAAVHGHCYTGALEVALAADFIVAASDARFADTHARWSLTPLWGMSQRLPRRLGLAAAKRLMFTADTIAAEDAVRIGLAEYAVLRSHLRYGDRIAGSPDRGELGLQPRRSRGCSTRPTSSRWRRACCGRSTARPGEDRTWGSG